MSTTPLILKSLERMLQIASKQVLSCATENYILEIFLQRKVMSQTTAPAITTEAKRCSMKSMCHMTDTLPIAGRAEIIKYQSYL